MFKKLCEFLFGTPVTAKPAAEKVVPVAAETAPAPAKAKKPRKAAAPKKKSKSK